MFVFLCFALLLALILKLNFSKNFTDALLVSAISFSGFIVLLTELLSVFKSLNLLFVSISWGLAFLILLACLLRNRVQTVTIFKSYKSSAISIYKNLTFPEKSLAVIIVIFLLALLIQGIIYPSNNWDTLTYHMPRIMYWLGNESVAHFPTFILRNLYQPPFSEYFVMHINLLNGNDYLSSSVQWLFLVMSLFAVSAILSVFKVSRFYKLLAMLLLISIPSLELQSTTAKNDIICGFFMLATIYFCMRSYSENRFTNWIFLGLSVGLCMFTKGTSYLFLLPILLSFLIAIVRKAVIQKNFSFIGYGFLIVLIVGAINGPHFSRNYGVIGNILNIDKVESKEFSNVEMSPGLLLSSLIKNAGLHAGYPIKERFDSLVHRLHKMMDIPLDGKNNYWGNSYDSAKLIPTTEDLTSNTLHFFLIAIAYLVVLVQGFREFRKNQKYLLLAAIILAQMLLFAGILKWQPWHTRLHIPIFMLSVILVIGAAQLSKWFKYLLIATIPVMLYSFYFFCAYNHLRPLIKDRTYTASIKPSDSRFEKYFTNQPFLYPEYDKVDELLYDVENLHKIGIIMDEWEYPLLTSYYYNHVQIQALEVHNTTSNIPQDTKNIDVIISSRTVPFMMYNGRKYVNQTPGHSHINLYK